MKGMFSRLKSDDIKVSLFLKSGYHKVAKGRIKEVSEACLAIDEGNGEVLYVAMDNIAAFRKIR